MSKNREYLGLIDRTAAEYISSNRDRAKSYPGHELPHLRNVAQLTELVGLLAGYSEREIELSRIAGWFHDFNRSSNEANREKDARLSADAALDYTQKLNQVDSYRSYFKHRTAIEHAISEHAQPPSFFAARPDPKFWTLPERVQASLFVADKLEANGVWVIARRSQFVAGARLRSEQADLPEYGLTPGKDESKAVLLESGLRIAFLNPEGIYPPVFKNLVSKMYGPQRDFIHGLLSANSMTIEDYAKMILNTKLLTDPKQPNYIKARGLDSPQDVAGLIRILQEKGGLSDDKIEKAARRTTFPAIEAVLYFSSQYQTPLEQLVDDWKPRHPTSRSWRASMVSYMTGEWFNKVRKQLTHK